MQTNFHYQQTQHVYKHFINDLSVKNYQTGHGQMYGACVREFLYVVEEQLGHQLEHISGEFVRNYCDYLETRPTKFGSAMRMNTYNHHMFALRLFFRFCEEHAIIPLSFTLPSYQRGFKETREALTVPEIEALFAACINLKEKAVLALLYGCGLRRTEAIRLQMNDFMTSRSFILVEKGKNSKRREVPLQTDIKKILSDYVFYERAEIVEQTRAITPNLLINTKGRAMSGDYIYDCVKQIAKRTNLGETFTRRVNLHILRHSIATHLSENGAPIDFIKDFLGHTSIDTTQIYALKNKQTIRFAL
jgi:integrase/recombinase XerD